MGQLCVGPAPGLGDRWAQELCPSISVLRAPEGPRSLALALPAWLARGFAR